MKCTKTPFTTAQHGHAQNLHECESSKYRIKALIALEVDDPEDFFSV